MNGSFPDRTRGKVLHHVQRLETPNTKTISITAEWRAHLREWQESRIIPFPLTLQDFPRWNENAY